MATRQIAIAGVALFLAATALDGTLAGPGPAGAAQPLQTKARYRGRPRGCGRGNFFDPRKGGECWSCRGWHRTATAVTSRRACRRNAYEKFKHARKGKKTVWAWECKGKWFWDGYKGGRCWSCEGWRRTAYHIKSGKACVRRVSAAFRRAKYIGKFVCPGGQFFDPLKGGQCWSCPGGYIRSVTPVTSKKACIAGPALAKDIVLQIAAEKTAALLLRGTKKLVGPASALESKAKDADEKVTAKTTVVADIKQKSQVAVERTKDAVKRSEQAVRASQTALDLSERAARGAATAKDRKCRLCRQR